MEFKHLDSYLKTLAPGQVPGIDCAVYHRHEPVYRTCYGYADAEKQVPITTDTMYYLYSVTKLFTCTAALQLHEQGAFLMFQPVSDFIPEYGKLTVWPQTAERRYGIRTCETADADPRPVLYDRRHEL